MKRRWQTTHQPLKLQLGSDTHASRHISVVKASPVAAPDVRGRNATVFQRGALTMEEQKSDLSDGANSASGNQLHLEGNEQLVTEDLL